VLGLVVPHVLLACATSRTSCLGISRTSCLSSTSDISRIIPVTTSATNFNRYQVMNASL